MVSTTDRPEQERTLKDITPNAAALLCYLAGWITGIIFLVLEQKNRFVRFHSLQSIIVFGILSLASLILGPIPFIGQGFQWALTVTSIVLWIILMIKAYHGEVFKIPWAGNLAEKLTNDTLPPRAGKENDTTTVDTQQSAGAAGRQDVAEVKESTAEPAAAPVEPIPPAPVQSAREEFKTQYYSSGEKTSRMLGSAFAIAWSLILVVFFVFYNEYIAYYHVNGGGGITVWQRDSILTHEFSIWLPIVSTALIINIIGNSFLIAYDKFLARKITQIITDVLGAAAVISLLVIYPFDFHVIPNQAAVTGVNIGVTAVLIIIAVGFCISAIVKFIQTIIHAVEGKY